MIGYVITIGIFVILQVGSGVIILTKLQGGQSALKEHLDSLAASVTKLSEAVQTINISDARFEERYAALLQTMGVVSHDIAELQAQVQRLRSRVHQLHGFVMRAFPEWKEIESQTNVE